VRLADLKFAPARDRDAGELQIRRTRSRTCLASVVLAFYLHDGAAAAETPPFDPRAAAPAASQAVTPAVIDPANLLLFSVSLDAVTLTDGLAVYGQAEDPYVPMGELARLLQMDVDVFPSEQRISGALGEARRPLLVDLRNSVARVGGGDVPLTGDDVAVTPTEIYLRASAIQRLLPLKMEIHPDTLEIRLTATELLPIQARLQRLANRPAEGRQGGADEPLLRVQSPYRLFTPPSADVTLNLGARSQDPTAPFRYDLRLAGDFLYADLQAYLASDDAGRPATGRFLLQRRSVEGDLLGPLHAHDLEVGDTFSPALPVGPRSVGGRGIMFSTTPLEQASVFNRIDLRGELPVGYDVELYINDILRASQDTPNNGRYEFLNVPLQPGVNVIRTVLYSPRGERTEDTRVINVGGGLLHRGEADIQFGVVEQDVPLVDFNHGFETSLDPTTPRGGMRAVGSLAYGLTNFLTLETGAAIVPHLATASADDPRRADPTGIYNIGLRAPLGPLASQFDFAVDNHGGQAAVASVAGAFGGTSATLRHAEYHGGFVDENNIGAAVALTLERRTELTADSNLPLRGAILPVSLRLVRNGYADGSSDWQAAFRATSSPGRFLLSGGLEYDRLDYRPAAPVNKLTGYLSASTYRSFAWQLRSSLDFDIAPVFKARTLSITADRALSRQWSLQLALGDSLSSLDEVTVAVSSIYRSRFGDLQLTADYDNGLHSWEALAQLNFGLGYAPGRGYRITPEGPGSGGSALLEAFYDDNGNGVRDPGERPAPGVAIQSGTVTVATDKSGQAYVTGLGAAPVARMAVNLDALQDTTFVTPPTTLETSPRPGSVTRFSYPIQPTGGVTVIIELVREDGKKVGLSSVKVDLVSDHGKTVEQVTEFDGSAVFDQVPLGTYRLQLEPNQARQLRMHLTSAPTMVIRSDSFTPDVHAQVVFDPPPADAPAAG
jgi:hypothetical protein